MPAIVKELTIAATPGNVFNALTQQDKLALWWTSDLSVKPEVGSLAEFRFRQGAFALQLEIVKLDADENVSWICRQGSAGWAETSVTWQLTPVQSGTKVHFTHDGFTEVYEVQARGTWEYFLDSLKSYLETGKGTPGLEKQR
jgi:uncharacterized protein YndB with AHSA1/START domain